MIYLIIKFSNQIFLPRLFKHYREISKIQAPPQNALAEIEVVSLLLRKSLL